MNRKAVSGIMLTLLLMGMLTLTFNIQPIKSERTSIIVRDDHPTIQEAINAASPGDTIYVQAGTYYENVVVDKTVSLIGEDEETTIIDGNGTGFVVKITRALGRLWVDHVNISGFTIRGSGNQWIHTPYFTSWPEGGIFLGNARECVISNNIIIDNLGGATLHRSQSNIIKDNLIVNNEFGISLSSEGVDNVILENTIASNTLGLWYDLNFPEGYTPDNHVYHNDFINNRLQAHSFLATGSFNIWDDGYPSGGNYWSDYSIQYPSVVDEYRGENQDIPGSDGIWDHPYEIDAVNIDNYPLVEPWSPTPPIPTTIDELKTEIEELGSEDKIDNQGIATSLFAKLDAAQKSIQSDDPTTAAKNILEAFINEVQAQSGKHITPDAAELLIESAEYIIFNL